jgi:hypothetical protein
MIEIGIVGHDHADLLHRHDQYAHFGSKVIAVTEREGLHTLDAIVLADSDAPREHTADTHGATELVFGAFGLLGRRFIPRLGDIADVLLYGLGPLVSNAMVYWNTRYIAHALETLARGGHPVPDEDIRNIHPVHHEHINPYGHYRFDTRRAANGKLRPLRPANITPTKITATNATATNA